MMNPWQPRCQGFLNQGILIMEPFTFTLSGLTFVCVMVFFSGFVDSVAGGGGTISIPAYLFIGMPAHMALGCNKISAACGTTFSLARFMVHGALDVRTALLSAATSFIGSGLGTRLALHIADQKLKLLLLIILPFVAVFLLMKREYGAENRADEVNKKKAISMALLIGFMIGGYDGLFGPGAGTFAIIAYCTLMKYDLKTASGNAKMLNLASNYASAITFAAAGSVSWAVALPAAACGIAGNYIGSGLAIKNGARFIRPMMTVVIVLLLGKLAYDLYVSYAAFAG